MTESEAEEFYQNLVTALRKQSLDWLATQIEMEVAEGKTTPKLLTVFESYDGDLSVERDAAKGRSRRVEFAHVQPFTSQEKLEILIQAVRTIVVSSGKIFSELHMDQRLGAYQSISFVSEAGVESLELSSSQMIPMTAAADQLEQLLNKLDSEVSRND